MINPLSLLPSWVPYAAVGGAFLALAAYAGWQHMEVLELRTKAATEQAAAEKAVNDAKAADAVAAAKLTAEHAAEVRLLQENANAQQVTIAAAPTSDVCLHSAAGAAFLGGLRSATDQAGSAQPRSAAGAH